jgi:hypothetical protein
MCFSITEDNMMKRTALLMGLTLSGLSLACGNNGGGFVPENDLNIPAYAKGFHAGITEAQFNTAIDKVENIYKSIVSAKGGNLVVNRKWSDGTVNAYAQQSGKTWSVAMFGGLARHETITEDGLALVVCHEIGHHIGGAPRKGGSGGGWWSGGATSWASNEGQSDYFSSLKCLRRAFMNEDNATIVAGLNAPKALVDACTSSKRGDLAETNLCIRIGMAGKSVADLFSALSKLPEAKFDTPDPRVASATDDNHPKAQCRLDTYFQGALCEVNYAEDVSNSDAAVGTCTSANGFKEGNRPQCWFKAK